VLADKVDNTPALVALLQVGEYEGRHFRPPQSAAKKNSQNGPIPQAAHS
jgi:hypothetical protein